MRRFTLATTLALALALTALAPASADPPTETVGMGGGTPGTSENFELVGHDPLHNRGLNAALAIYEDYVYVGNRTDGSSRCGRNDPRRQELGLNECPHPNPGVLIVDASDPSDPHVVNEIGPPEQGNPGETSRELRVWPEKDLLVVMNFSCSDALHACAGFTWPELRFYDLSDPVNPERIGTYVAQDRRGSTRTPHEMALWIDPEDPDRGLMYLSFVSGSRNPDAANLQVVDISDVPDGGEAFPIAEGNWNHHYEPMGNLGLHSMFPSVDGKQTHLAYLSGHHLVLDTTVVAEGDIPEGEVYSLNDDLLTMPEDRPTWENPNPGHSAAPVPGKPYVFVTDEVYGTYARSSFGCPWGWSFLIDIEDPSQPEIASEYKVHENTEAFCDTLEPDHPTNVLSSFSAHNPTLTRELAFVTWHSAGLQAIDISDPAQPSQAGWFSPEPLDEVANEDPALSSGPDKVVMWSFPIIKDGLIYVTDVRNGLYILRYTGPGARRVSWIEFLEGNSNLGDAQRLDESGRPPWAPGPPDWVPGPPDRAPGPRSGAPGRP